MFKKLKTIFHFYTPWSKTITDKFTLQRVGTDGEVYKGKIGAYFIDGEEVKVMLPYEVFISKELPNNPIYTAHVFIFSKYIKSNSCRDRTDLNHNCREIILNSDGDLIEIATSTHKKCGYGSGSVYYAKENLDSQIINGKVIVTVDILNKNKIEAVQQNIRDRELGVT